MPGCYCFTELPDHDRVVLRAVVHAGADLPDVIFIGLALDVMDYIGKVGLSAEEIFDAADFLIG